MKKQLIAIVFTLTSCFGIANAQVDVRFNIGIQPLWGPTGYDYVNYYYLPDIDAYYDVPHQQYVYMEDNRWVTRPGLPSRYANYDMYHGYKVVVNERDPWQQHDRYRTQYTRYKGRHNQKMIRDSREQKYWENPGHPQHAKWHGKDDRDNHAVEHMEEGTHGRR